MSELTTDPFSIEVTSLLEGEFDPTKFRDVKAVAALPADRTWVWLWWTGGIVDGLAILIAAIAIVIVRYRRRSARTITIAPHEWAFQQLRMLADGKLIEAGKVREFYYRLSEIARTYIELRFGLMAPEQTTEEFLREMRSRKALPPEYQPQLADFLEACDMVKYALYEPVADEIEHVFNTARDFIAQSSEPARAAKPASEAEEVAA